MTFLARLFGRKPKPAPPIDRRGWSEDWQVGDVAVCVSANWPAKDSLDPRVGDTLRVSGVKYDASCLTGRQRFSGLRFDGKPGRCYQHTAFQKIRPAEQCFTEAMRNLLRQPVTPTGLPTADNDGGREGWDAPDHPGVNAGRNGGHHIPANPINVAIFNSPHRPSLGASDPPSQAHKK